MPGYREPNYRILQKALRPEPDGDLLFEMRQPLEGNSAQPLPAYIARGWQGDDYPYFHHLFIYMDQLTCDADWQRLVSDPEIANSDLHWIEHIVLYQQAGYRRDGTEVRYQNISEEANRTIAIAPGPILSFCQDRLFRARICLPKDMIEEDEPLMDRMVFFESPSADQSAAIIEALIAIAWQTDTRGWVDDDCIYDIEPATAIRSLSSIPTDNDIHIFEDGIGGDIDQAIGPERIRYVRAKHVDLYVSPPVSTLLHDALDAIEGLFAEQAKLGGFYRTN